MSINSEHRKLNFPINLSEKMNFLVKFSHENLFVYKYLMGLKLVLCNKISKWFSSAPLFVYNFLLSSSCKQILSEIYEIFNEKWILTTRSGADFVEIQETLSNSRRESISSIISE